MNHIDLAAFCDLIFIAEPNFNLLLFIRSAKANKFESYESPFNLFSTIKFNK